MVFGLSERLVNAIEVGWDGSLETTSGHLGVVEAKISCCAGHFNFQDQ